MTAKTNNNCKFPGANHQPRHYAKLRKEGALERQAAYDKLTLEEKIAKLPPEPFSAKQRNRLITLLDKRSATKVQSKELVKTETVDSPSVVVETVVTKETTKTKKYMRRS
jgi:hypothetical protein